MRDDEPRPVWMSLPITPLVFKARTLPVTFAEA